VTDCGDAKLLQRLVRQAGENRLVYVIFAECRLIPTEAQAPQPEHNVHGAPHNQGWWISSSGEVRVSRADWIMGLSEIHKDRCLISPTAVFIGDVKILERPRNPDFSAPEGPHFAGLWIIPKKHAPHCYWSRHAHARGVGYSASPAELSQAPGG
jgi:hypothetical protein